MKTVSILRLFLAILCSLWADASRAADQPNILWITSEDNGPQLGCYGDEYATTSNLDALAAKGMIYLHCWSTAPVCAPARTAIIAGVYPPSTGAQHMRSLVKLPPHMKMYPQFLREAGYYCSNNSKEDYNLEKPGKVWDDSSNQAHWKNRKPGQPFFAIFNHTVSHESQIRKRPHDPMHDPADVRVPAYHPDTPEVRQDWAQYYDKITEMDALAGRNLRELEEAGLAEDTIVFYYGDHGAGMPRSKRWPYNSGLHVPLIVYYPPQFRHLAGRDYRPGGESSRLVGFIDLAPTVLSLAGLEPPVWMQGHAFAGQHEAEPQPYQFGFRGRMDERLDLVRSVRDERYVYIRNYMPHKIYGQHIDYMFQTPATRVWKELYDAGKLDAPRTHFWEPKPSEELYDLKNDPDEVRNLAGSPEHREVLKKLRTAQQTWAANIRDVGFLPEAEMHARAEGSTPYQMGHDPRLYDFESVFAAAELASDLTREDAYSALLECMQSPDDAVRYWGTLGLLMRGRPAVRRALVPLRTALRDDSPNVRIAAAEALGRFGSENDVRNALDVLVKDGDLRNHKNVYVAIAALNAADELGEKASSRRKEIEALPERIPDLNGRVNSYVPRLLEAIQKTNHIRVIP